MTTLSPGTMRGRLSLPRCAVRFFIAATLCLGSWAIFGTTAAFAQTGPFTVNEVDDSASDGVCDAAGCTLRDAVDAANGTSGAEILFDENLAAAVVLTQGALSLDADMTIRGRGAGLTVIDGNNSDAIFEIAAGTTATILDVRLQNGSGANAGAIDMKVSSGLWLEDAVLADNAGAGGGALSLAPLANATVRRTLFSSNASTGSGGAILAKNAELLIEESMLFNNQTGGDGGGLHSQNSTVTLTNVTVSSNRAAGDGGGLSATGSGQLSVTYVTLVHNQADVDGNGGDGGGLANLSTARITGTLVVGNTANGSADDCGGTDPAAWVDSLGGPGCPDLLGNAPPNLDGHATAEVLSPTPAKNGGPTPTHALVAGSPALNLVDCTGNPRVDQRNEPRPGGSTTLCDAGAYERQVSLPDLAIAKAVNPAAVLPGQPLTYTIAVTNVGEGAALAYRVTDLFPTGLEVLSATPAPDADSTLADAAWTGAYLDVDDTARITVTARVRPDVTAGPITNTAGVSTALDLNGANDSASAPLTIVLPQIGLAATEVYVAEAAGHAHLEIRLDRVQPYRAVSVSYTTAAGTADAEVDYTTSTGTAVIAANTLTATIPVPIRNDDLDELDETVLLTLQNPDGARLVGATTATLTIRDDDVAGVQVSAISGDTSEDGDQATFTVRLTSRPAADVTLMFRSSDPSEGVPDATLTVRPEEWTTVRSIKVTGWDDLLDDGDVGYVINTNVTSVDPAYDGLAVEPIQVINRDNDTAAIRVSAISTATTEAGGTATFTVALSVMPTAPVTVDLASSDEGEGIVTGALLFTPAAWEPQTATVTGVDDPLVDGDTPYLISTSVSTVDGAYAALDPDDVAVLNRDDDTAGFLVGAPSGPTDESGLTATVAVRLTARPTAAVRLLLTSSDEGEGVVAPALTITPDQWNVNQIVTVTGVDDPVADGTSSYAIAIQTESDDPAFDGLPRQNVWLENLDNDASGLLVTTLSTVTTEAGATASLRIGLATVPTEPVTVTVTSSAPDEGTPVRAAVVFTPPNRGPETVAIRGVDDDVDDGDVDYSVTLTVAGTDTGYGSLPPVAIAFVNQDDDTAGIRLTEAVGNTSENGAQATFGVQLESRPTASVRLTFTSSDPTEGNPEPSLTVEPDAWNIPQSVTVTGVDDLVADGPVEYAISTGVVSADPGYAALSPADVRVVNQDNDTASIRVSRISTATTEAGGTAAFTVVLTSMPTAAVQVNLLSSDPGEGTVIPGLTFAPDSWDTPQTVTVTGRDDGMDDGDVRYGIQIGTISGDSAYDGLEIPDVAVLNLDDDLRGVIMSGTMTQTTEAGAAAIYAVSLTSMPTATVTVAFTSTDVTEGLPSPLQLTFQPDTWMTPQSLTISGLDDAMDDGDRPYQIRGRTQSADPVYADLPLTAIPLVNLDDDESAISFLESDGETRVVEGGTVDSYEIRLETIPTETVSVTVTVSATEQLDISLDGIAFQNSLTFTRVDQTPQIITVRALDDAVAEVITKTVVISHVVTSSDPAYAVSNPAMVNLATVTALVRDNDRAELRVTGPASRESAGALDFTVMLSGTVDAPFTVDVETMQLLQQARPDLDYQPVAATLTFTGTGGAQIAVAVPIVDEDLTEPDEQVGLHLAGIVSDGRTIDLPDGPAIGTILNDDGDLVCLPGNLSWTGACELELRQLPDDATAAAVDAPRARNAVVAQVLEDMGQSRWYKFSVEPNSQLYITLRDLPDNYDIAVYKDISATLGSLVEIDGTDDLKRLGAEFASAAFSPAAFSPAAFSPAAFSPAAFSPAAFSPAAFSPAAFSPAAFSPAAFSPAAFSPAAFSPAAFSPAAFSPAAFSPAAFSPAAFSPAAFSPAAFSPAAFGPAAFSSAESRSLLAVSAFDGRADEGIFLNTWESTGDYYVRVRGRNGSFDPRADYELSVTLLSGICRNINPFLPARAVAGTAGDYRTLIVIDRNRFQGDSDARQTMEAALQQLADRPEVQGVIVDVGADPRVLAANVQADENPGCPYAKNLVAYAVKEIIDSYRAMNPLEYLVLIGNDDVVPFFRHPDESNLGNERNYVPPVFDATASQASLRLGYVLGQDRYGARSEVSIRSGALPIPDLAVGRLVETPDEVTQMIRAYLSTADGVTPTVGDTLVTGYDFLADVAGEMQTQLRAATGEAPTTLITPRDVSPADPRAWTADDLRSALFARRYGLGYLAGHFSASTALAADFATTFSADELAASNVDMTNAVFFSNGCHSGYNIVANHAIPGVTREPDWAQAFARKGATFIGGTGYQYGDTDFIEYGERLYLDFVRELRSSEEPVAVGKALNAAKLGYLTGTAMMRPLDEKSLLVSTLYGLPMLRVDLPGPALAPVQDPRAVADLADFQENPGLLLGLLASDLTITPQLDRTDVPLVDVTSGTTITTSFWSNAGHVSVTPAEPVLPQAVYNVEPPADAGDVVLRGVGFRGGSYADLTEIAPLVSATTTEIRGVHPVFATEVFFPMRPWTINYWRALAGGDTYLQVTPAQYRSDPAALISGSMRLYQSMTFRLYYSGNIETYAPGVIPAMANAPAITNVRSDIRDGRVYVSAQVTGHPSAGIQEVWIVYTSEPTSGEGRWEPLDLVQNEEDSTLWEGSFALGELEPSRMRFLVQAVNGVGLVSMDDGFGRYHIPGRAVDNVEQLPTELAIVSAPSAAMYGSEVKVAVRLTSAGAPLAGQWVNVNIDGLERLVRTDANGEGTVAISLIGNVGQALVQASFRGTDLYDQSIISADLLVEQDTPAITARIRATVLRGDRAYPVLEATVESNHGQPLGQRTVFVTITDADGESMIMPVMTDYAGRVVLDLSRLDFTAEQGEYTFLISFAKALVLPDGTQVDLSDERHAAVELSKVVAVTVPPPPAAEQHTIWLPMVVADR